jgi:putative nucleotidyltransferase with HDIG domain
MANTAKDIVKKNSEKSPNFLQILRRTFNLSALRPLPALVSVLSFLLVFLAAAGNQDGGGTEGDIKSFEAGLVADRDIQAEEDISYVDSEATRRQMEIQERLVCAVFRFSSGAKDEALASWRRFTAFAENIFREESSPESFKLKVQAEFPGMFSGRTLGIYFADPSRDRYGEYGAVILRQIMEAGVFALPENGLDRFSQEAVELVFNSEDHTEWERVPYHSIITKNKIGDALKARAESSLDQSAFSGIVPELVGPFVRENVFFSGEDTRQRLQEAQNRVEPVIKHIEKGKKVIRKGFVITEENLRDLRALNFAGTGRDPRDILDIALLYLLLYGILVFLCGGKILLERDLSDSEIYLLCALAVLYLAASALLKNLSFPAEYIPVSLLLPSALFVMLPALLISFRISLVFAIFLPLAAFSGKLFDGHSLIFAVLSGVVATYSLQGAEKRMDLVRAGLIIAAVNALVMTAILLNNHVGPGGYPPMLFWAAFNGMASGMLVAGVLPPLEHALNAVTVFRLIELSDLNSPTLKALFTAASGTYSHSIMVANLAEAACHDIGANSLLARVGAYYHDIGKMDNPSYFVENQTDYNRHDDIAPRLSATVIRSHVKLGVERAQALGLPQAVTDIVAEHHGNSVITWFYNKARQQEAAEGKGEVDIADFSYPGTPPRSRESAVVMLADVTEAAVRTLQKPTVPKMEKFIQELFAAKVEHGQLALSELTFRDLETIRKAFVRVLAGYYHSRIEYPKLAGESQEAKGEGKPAAGAPPSPAGEAGKSSAGGQE